MACANGEAVERVLANLLHNAGKYARTALEASAAEGAPAAGSCVVLVLANDADALGEDAVARLFQPFFMADASRAREGSGLGLAIVKHAVLYHHGSIEVESAEGAGTTFVLRFPAA